MGKPTKIDDSILTSTPLDAFNVLRCNPGVFAGAGTNARGDHDGTQDPTTLFKVTGAVLMRIFGVVKVTLTGASATIEVGVAGNTAALIAQEVGTDLVAGGIYLSATQVLGVVPLATLPGPFIVDRDVIETVSTANITAGEIEYYCLWRPLSPDGNVESAV